MSDNNAPYSKMLAVEIYPASSGTITLDVNEYHFLQSEIARLKAELEKAERENDRLQSALKEEVSIASNFAEVAMMRTTQRDEARRLARHFYRMYLAVGFDNSWDV